jgi:hypothetical protein
MHLTATHRRPSASMSMSTPRSCASLPLPPSLRGCMEMLFSEQIRTCCPDHNTTQGVFHSRPRLQMRPQRRATNVSRRPRLECNFVNRTRGRMSGRCSGSALVIPGISSLPLGFETSGSALRWTLDQGFLLPKRVGPGHVRGLNLD